MSESKVLKLKPYENKDFININIDFVTIYKNSYLNVASTIDALYRTVLNPFNIILFDNNSDNTSFAEDFSKFNNISFIRTNKNVTLGECFNNALKRTENSWIVFISNNILPISVNWSTNLLSSIQQYKSRGVKLISPLIKNNKFFEKFDKDSILVEGEFLPLHCFICHRDLFSLIGLMNPKLETIEDISEDFYARMKARNLKQGVCYKSWVKQI